MINVSIHGATQVSIETETVQPHGSIGSSYVVTHVTVHHTDNAGKPQRVTLALFGNPGVAEMPVLFAEPKS